MKVTMILPLTGAQYSEKVAENCIAIWKLFGIYTDAEAKAVEKFVEVFKDEIFPPGSSILFTQSLQSLTVSKLQHALHNLFYVFPSFNNSFVIYDRSASPKTVQYRKMVLQQ